MKSKKKLKRYSMRILQAFLLLMFFSQSLWAQEKLYPLKYNPQLYFRQQEAPKEDLQPRPLMKHGIHVQKLPFFDDFSSSQLLPNDTLWLDSNVYINNTMAFLPPSIGVATFDGLNLQGTAYIRGSTSEAAGGSDTLTSTWIDLSPYTEADSIYLSFFYQPGGYGDSPEDFQGDSFIVEFKPDTSFFSNNDLDSNSWIKMWGAAGSGVKPFSQVMIPLRMKGDTNFFHDRFQFRFVNLGTRAGNLDHWHLDYVYLDRGRTAQDTAHEDVAIYYPSRPVIKRYTQMPYNQFINDIFNYYADSIFVFGTNNSDKIKNVAFGYSITNMANGNLIASEFNTQGDNVNPREYRTFSFATQNLSNIPSSGDKVDFLVKTSVSNVPDDHRQNDTAFYIQHFNNLYAYDDGVADAGYGLTDPKGGRVALEFALSQPDTLYGVAIHFTQVLADVSNRSFTIAVWDELNSDEPRLELTGIKPQYLPWMNGFYFYEFPEPLPVSDKFYVGWTQNSEFVLNVGYDANYRLLNPEKQNPYLHYYTKGSWKQSLQRGTLMIRPNVGKRFVASAPPAGDQVLEVNVYPNPGPGLLNIELPDERPYTAVLYDMQGHEIMHTGRLQGRNVQLDCRELPRQLYLLRVISADGSRQAVKKIILN